MEASAMNVLDELLALLKHSSELKEYSQDKMFEIREKINAAMEGDPVLIQLCHLQACIMERFHFASNAVQHIMVDQFRNLVNKMETHLTHHNKAVQ
jgi:hypothetical protein